MHCPRSSCQTIVTKSVTEDGDKYENLRTCPKCGLSFCALCKRTWWVFITWHFLNSFDVCLSSRHGLLVDCATEKIVTEYLSLAPESPQRLLMERQHNKARLLRLVSQREEEKLTQRWIENSTMSCPNCRVKVEKSQGCNHVCFIL